MNYYLFKGKIIRHLEDYKVYDLGCTNKGIHNGQIYNYILPYALKELNYIPGILPLKDKLLCKDEAHLNSSRIMGINYFQKLQNNMKIIDILKCISNINFLDEVEVVESKLIYDDPIFKDNLGCDFYVILSTGEKIYFKLKYTENSFGSYEQKESIEKIFNDILKTQLQESLYLKKCTKEEFFNHYGIYRNIANVISEKDYMIFIYLLDNDNLQKERAMIENYKNVYWIDWRELIIATLATFKNTKDYRIYKEFEHKYLDY